MGVKRQRDEGGGATEEGSSVTSGGGQAKKSIWDRLGEKVGGGEDMGEVKSTKASFITQLSPPSEVRTLNKHMLML